DIYASTNFNVFLSSNNGADWTKISTGLLTVYTVASNGEIVLAGSNDSGVHLLTKDSTSWNTIYKGLIYKYVKTISIIGNNIFVGTEGLGIYRRPISEITAIQEIIKEPTFTIAPNPFSTETTITFSEEQINTTVKIVDLLGIEYKSIKFNGKQLDIKRGDLNCGIYFIQILSENGTAMLKKIIIL
ncbi:MAG TPA: T9SS type A sorting domain-containing protein, partial [Saprospiraceae bacterium]|nr:T9SS type A sorting domain-containing protein [Saprospiraceae bacterium]